MVAVDSLFNDVTVAAFVVSNDVAGGMLAARFICDQVEESRKKIKV